MDDMEKEAIIIGGSNAGLMCGIMLKHHGYNVTILEQEASQSRQGYDAGISFGPAVQEFLDKHDRVKRDMVITCPLGLKINRNGEAKVQNGQPMVNTSWGLLISVLRANFDGTTSKAVPEAPKPEDADGKATFRSGCRVTNVELLDGKMKVEFEESNTGAAQTLSTGLVIAADGSNSGIRKILLPDIKREYAGYMCWRGTVREELIEEKWNDLYAQKATFHFMQRTYMVNYTIPTDDGDLSKGKRLHNWIWYSNLSSDASEVTQLFTDTQGKLHRGTVPRGLVQEENWTQQKKLADEILPEGLAAIVKATKSPFVTKVFDVTSNQANFFDGKLFLIGDAQITLRPNVGMSTAHAAYDCNELEKVIEGSLTPVQWEREVLKWGAAQRRFAITIATYGLGTMLATIGNAALWAGLLAGQKIGLF